MKLSAVDAKRFPKFAAYIKQEMPKLANVPVIVNTIKKYSGATKLQKIKSSLVWGFGPSVKIVKNLSCAGQKAYGCYRVWGAQELEIDEKLVTLFGLGKTLEPQKRGKK